MSYKNLEIMKKSFLFLAVAAGLMFTACSNGDDDAQGVNTNGQQPSVANRLAVGFDAYTGRATTGSTRAGFSGDLTDALLQDNTANGANGFGVFAYYTDLKKYDQTYVPNFMYNTHVTYDSGSSAWTYSPLMYWPNEYGSNATSDDEDKVSFFAYAPYVAHASAAAGSVTGDATSGITGFSRNTTTGDPLVKYITAFGGTPVDLCWGVVGDSDTGTTDWTRTQGGTQSFANGKPWLDVERPSGLTAATGAVKFNFRHALAKLAVKIDADADVTTHGSGDAIDTKTRIYVRSISFTGIATKGALNLNNSTAGVAQWLDYSGTTDLPYGESVTVKDGRRDGREGGTGAAANNETPAGLNEVITQVEGGETLDPAVAPGFKNAGVTNTAVDLFSTANVYVIPTGETMTVTIVYDVETVNDDLPTYISDGVTHGVSIENRITKTGIFTGGLVSGKAYTLKLHLGMNSVKFDATVGDWGTGTEEDQWLPAN